MYASNKSLKIPKR